jgi:methyl-accepting chemotaxis protein
LFSSTNFRGIGVVAATLLCVGLASFQGGAAEPFEPSYVDPVLEPWRWQSFPELKGTGLRCLTEAADGAMWFGTNEGVRRYDGLEWKTYTPAEGLLGAPVNVLYAANDGSVYAGGETGISRFTDGHWQRFFPPEGDLPWPIDAITESSDGSLWAATAWGGLQFSGDRATVYTTDQMAVTLREQASYISLSIVPNHAVPEEPWRFGTGINVLKGGYLGIPRGEAASPIWALASGGPGEAAGLKVGDHILSVDGRQPEIPHLILEGKGGQVSLVVKRMGMAEPFKMVVDRGPAQGVTHRFAVSSVFEDDQGRFWFGLTWGGGLVRFEPGAEDPWRFYGSTDGVDVKDLPKITQTRDGAIWSISNHAFAGLNRFDGSEWTQFRLSSLSENNVNSDTNTSILETSDGTLWIGGGGGFLHVLRDGKWSVWGPSDTPVSESRVIGLHESSDGSLWIAGLGQEAIRLDHGNNRWKTFQGLDFQCETGDGALWFLASDTAVVRGLNEAWTRFGPADGLMDNPTSLLATRDGRLWSAGAHSGVAATAEFDGVRWELATHPEFSRSVDRRAILEAIDGTIWVGAESPGKGQVGGLLGYDGERWTLHAPAEGLGPFAYDIGQTINGDLWVGGGGLRRYDGESWSIVKEPRGVTSWVHGLLGTPDGDLWVGTRTYGLFRYSGEAWTQYGVGDGLPNDRIRDIEQTRDGSIWVSTDKGISRFDGSTWSQHTLLKELSAVSLRQSLDGALWIGTDRGTLRYVPDRVPPVTEITLALAEVSQPGNTTVKWKATDPWLATPDDEIQFSWRLDEGPWSTFSQDASQTFLSLPSGHHNFEVKSRDRDFNEDPTPALARFYVTPPVWMQPWFISLIFISTGLIVLQTVRVVGSARRARVANLALAKQALEATLLHRTSQIASETGTIEEILQKCVDLVCSQIGWPVGHVYETRDGEDQLYPTGIWHLSLAKDHEEFRRVTESTTFERGVGLPGRIWASGEPAWIKNVQIDPNFPRNKLCSNMGVKGAFGFPVEVRGEIVAVLEFFIEEEAAPDQQLLETIGSVGEQISRVFERRRADEETQTAREEAERFAHEAESASRSLSDMLANIPTNIMMADLGLKVTYVNPAMMQVLERLEADLLIPPGQVVGRPLGTLHHGLAVLADILVDPARLPHQTRIEIGPEVISLLGSPSFDRQGRFSGPMVTWELITEEVRLEEAHQEAAERERQQLERERQQTEAERSRSQELQEKVDSMLEVVRAAEAGDLTHVVAIHGDDAIGQMGSGLGQFLGELRDQIGVISLNAHTIASASGTLMELSRAMGTNALEASSETNEVSSSARTVSDSLQTIAAAVEELTYSIAEISDNADRASKMASDAVGVTESTGRVITQLGESTAKISDIIKLITSIAEQTNTLALNATIEAGRAGDAGKSFAVVADEVKQLSQEITRSTGDVRAQIEGIQSDTQDAVDAVRKVNMTIEEINDLQAAIAAAVDQNRASVSEMSQSITRAAEGSLSISDHIDSVAETVRNTATGAKDTESAASQLEEMASELQGFVGRFKVEGEESNKKEEITRLVQMVQEQADHSGDDQLARTAAEVIKLLSGKTTG